MPPKDINDLRRERTAAAQAMTTTADALSALENEAEGADEAAHASAMQSFSTAEATFKRLDAQVKRQEQVDAANAAGAAPEPAAGDGSPAAQSVPAVAVSDADRGMGAGMIVGALAVSKGNREAAVAYLDKEGQSAIGAALSGATSGAGGVTIPRPLASEIIGLLRPRVTVRASGARSVPMPAGELRYARLQGSATASYSGENAAIVESEQTFGNTDMKFKKLTSLVPVGNSLMSHSAMEVGRIVRDDMTRVMALKEDLAFLRFDGTNLRPTGLRYWAAAGQWAANGVAASLAAAEAAARGAVNRVEDRNVGMVMPGWIMRAGVKNWLASLRDPNGNFAFPSIDASGELLGYPIKVTSQIPTNLGAGGDESEVYFADFSEIVIGDAQVIRVDVSTEAAFTDVNGDTVSAYQNDLTLMRAIAEHDLAPMHDVAISGFNTVGWGL